MVYNIAYRVVFIFLSRPLVVYVNAFSKESIDIIFMDLKGDHQYLSSKLIHFYIVYLFLCM